MNYIEELLKDMTKKGILKKINVEEYELSKQTRTYLDKRITLYNKDVQTVLSKSVNNIAQKHWGALYNEL